MERPMICSSTQDEFNFMNDEEFDIGAFLMVKHTAEVRQKYFEDKRQGKFKDAYLSQVVFTLNVMFGEVFVDKGSDVYVFEYSQAPVAFHSSDKQYFLGTWSGNHSENEKILEDFYTESFVNFAHRIKPNNEWDLFNHITRNYYSVEVNIEEGIFPRNKLNYHSATVDYWLHNITSFDASLTKKVRLQVIDTVSNPSSLPTVFTNFLFKFGLVVPSIALMAV
ncbi:hypothetical protein ANCCAN_19916, partial [Ancylostoma caninum]